MFKIIRIVVEFKEYITLSMLIVICFALMSLGDAAQLRGFRTFVVAGIGVAQNLVAWIPNPAALKSENQALRDLNLYLSSEVVATRKAKIENEQLRGYLELRETLEYPVVAAEVIGTMNSGLRNYITLNVGTDDGVQPGMAVVTDLGLVGHVLIASAKYSQVQLILNSDTRIAVKIERARVNGILAWEGGEQLVLRKIAKSHDVQAGDILVTSGYSTRFPRNIYVGRVTEVQDDPSSLFRKIQVMPMVNFETLEQVFVRLELPDPERLWLRDSLQSILQSKK